MTTLTQIPSNDLAWLAGLLEGEGYFGTIRNHVGGKVYPYPRVGVTMTDRDVIARVAALWSVKVNVVRPYGVSKKTSYRVQIIGRRAAEMMLLLYAMMGTRRRAQIDGALGIARPPGA